jgi:polysaccharide transporter, PST family
VNSHLTKLWQNSAIATLRSLTDRRVAETAFALYGAQALNYLLPLVTIPYLARVLGPETWGLIVFIQSIGFFVQLAVNYSFDLSATKEVARLKETNEPLDKLVAGVVGARVFISGICVVLIAVAQFTVPVLSNSGWLLWLGVIWFLANAWRPFWFFLGIEKVRWLIAIEAASKVSAVALIILLVNSPDDAWKVLGIYALMAVAAVMVTSAMLYRHVAFQFPTLQDTTGALRKGWDLFVVSMSTSLYNMSNSLILGLVASPLAVAYYGGAEKISRALSSAVMPVLQAMFPRASILVYEDSTLAARRVRWTILVSFVLSCCAFVVLYFSAPVIVRLILGPGYYEAVPVLRTLSLLLPLMGISLPLTFHWMVPIGLERLMTKLSLGGGLVHIPFAVALGVQFAHIGIAWAIVITETGLLIVAVGLLIIRELSPFGKRMANVEKQLRGGQLDVA